MVWEEHVEKLFPNTVEELKTVMFDMEFEWHFHFAFSETDGSTCPLNAQMEELTL